MANTRIKIRRDDLIAKLKQNRDEADKKFEKDTAAYENAKTKAAIKVRAALQTLLSADDEDLVDKVDTRYNGVKWIDLGKITIPSAPVRDRTQIEHMIRVLESSCDETISVAVGDAYARYL